MGAFTFLSDSEVREGRSVPDDKACDELLQELRTVSGEDWIVRTRRIVCRRSLADRLLRRPERIVRDYTLYADCHGEWQVINLVTPAGGSVFHGSRQSREDVMNFIMGMLNGFHSVRPA